MAQFQRNTVIGYMVYLGMKHPVLGIGPVGMVQQQNNYVLVDCYITKMHTVVIGPKMLKDVKNTVSFFFNLNAAFNLFISFFCLALCNDDANGNVPLGKSCNRYWQCQGGYPRLQRCPAMLVFDRRSLRCVVPPTEDCDIPTTPTPVDGEASENNQGPLVGIE